MAIRPNDTAIPRILRGVALTGAVCAGLVIAGVVVLWDADLYGARDRFEHARLALFGGWQPENWCPPGRESETCGAVKSFEAALEEASDFTFFRSAPIEGTGLSVQTGIRFTTARDVVDGVAAQKWCYVSIPDGAVSRKINLAEQSADDPPVYAGLSSLDESALAGTGLSVEALRLMARSHCRFDN